MDDPQLLAFTTRLREAGVPPEKPLEYGAQPMLRHAARVGQPAQAWLAPLGDYVIGLHRLAPDDSLWSPLYFCVSQVAEVAGDSPSRFGELLGEVLGLFEELDRHRISRTRTEQYGVRAAAGVIGARPGAFSAALSFARELARHGEDPGYLLQAAVPALWETSRGDERAFAQRLDDLGRAALRIAEFNVSVGYPFAVGVAALARCDTLETHWAPWLERLVSVARSLAPTQPGPYQTFEYGLPGAAEAFGREPDALTAALDVAVVLADRGIIPGPTLQSGFTRGARASVAIEFADALARDGIDPYFVLMGAMPLCADGGPGTLGEAALGRMLALARRLHACGHPVRRTFEEGLPVLQQLAMLQPGLPERGLALAEALAERGLNPATTLAYGLPRALAWADQHAWLPEECLTFAAELIGSGVDPEPALSYAVRPLARLAQGDADRFRALRQAVQALVATLGRHGIDVRDVLFHDVRSLADAGGQSQAFMELLSRLQALLDVWARRGLDPEPLLREGLPAAAREAEGKPWVLLAALEAASRLAEAGKGAEVTELLRHGTAPLVQAAQGDPEAFSPLLATLERHYAELPAEWMGPASVAACRLAGRDAEVLDRALTLISARLGAAPAGAVRDEVARTLPALARMASTPEALGALIDSALEAAGALSDDGLRHAWHSHAVEAVADVAGASEGARPLMQELARRVSGWGAQARAVLALGAQPAAVAARDDAAQLLRNLEAVDGALHACARAETKPEMVLPLFLELARSVSRPRPASFPEVLSALGEVLSWDASARTQGVDALTDVRRLVARWPEAWERLVVPTLRTHRQRAWALLSALVWLNNRHLHQPSDLDVLRELLTQSGVRSVSVLRSLVIPAMYSGALPDLTAHRELLARYLREVSFLESGIYARFVEIHEDARLSDAEKRERTVALRAEIEALGAALRAGEVSAEQEKSPLFPVALQHVFPPSVAAAQETYEELYRHMPDRAEDLHRLDPGDLRRRRYALAGGRWQLREGAAFDRGPWERILAVTRELPEAPPEEPLARVGWELLSAWAEGRVGREGVGRALLVRLLRHLPAAQHQVPREAETPEQLLALRELLADRVRDLVEAALLASRGEDAERYGRLVRDKLAPPAKVGPGLIKNVWRVLEALRGGGVDGAEAGRRLAGLLRGFAVEEDALVERLGGAGSPDEVGAALATLEPRPVRVEAAKEVHRLHADLVGQDVQAMQLELYGGPGRPGALVYRTSSEAFEIELEVTKRRAHAAVGITEGVCVAHDRALWNNPDFLQVIFWGPASALGGMHLLVMSDPGGRYLALPGINPTVSLLERAEVASILDAAIDYAWRLARRWKLAGVWVPALPGIHSNRQRVHEEILRRGWRHLGVQTHPFSFSPHRYAIDEVLVVPEAYVGEPPRP